jgi:hypothetical protein
VLNDEFNGVESAFLEAVHNVAAGNDHHRMTVFADFIISLAVHIGRSDEHAKLPVK